MRVERLEFANIGPFPGGHRIDFGSLSGSLFLIDGPTGAGKTTIIDAIVFALYGRVAGQKSDDQRLRSLFAQPDEPSYVELEFAVHDQLYRIRRTPRYERQKLRGTGTRTQPSEVTLHAVIDGEPEFISSRIDDVAHEIQRLIGLDSAQFVQTVVLPQGEFAAFLNANSADRKPLLQRIFGTHRFESVETYLEDRRREAQHEREESRQRLTELMNRCAGVFGFVTDEPPSMDQMRALHDEAIARETQLRDDLAPAESEDAKAQEVAGIASRVHAARLRLTRAEKTLTDAQRAVEDFLEVHPQVNDTDDPSDVLVALRETSTEMSNVLRGIEERIQVHEALDTGHRRQGERAARRAEIERARDVEVPEHLRELLALAVAADLRAGEDVETARRDHANSAAIRLADDLQPGSPCPVCGSVEHPHPARGDVAVDLEAALRLSQRASELVRDIGEKLASTSAGIVATDSIDIDALTERKKSLDRMMRSLDSERERLDVEDATWAEERTRLEERLDQLPPAELDESDIRRHIEDCARDIQAWDSLRVILVKRDEQQREFDDASTDPSLTEDVPDPELAQQLAADARQKVTQIRTLLESQQRAVREGAAILADVSAAEQAVDSVETETAPIIRMADVVSGRGDNQLGQPLSMYVLQQMFDDVVEATNDRLSGMLGGRYELRATEAGPDRRQRKSGLDVEIVDYGANGEHVRRTTSLSGGETFCVSLALALGLADTVRAYAGGIPIDTLFIDEGFGSLDADTLDDVMEQLYQLSSNGRTVGVISHVAEMKVIPERIDVRPGVSGSNLWVTWADGTLA